MSNERLSGLVSCFTTDDGKYVGRIGATDANGSFELSAYGKPFYIMRAVNENTSFGFVSFGGRNVALPGVYQRSDTEPGCWINDSTLTSICVAPLSTESATIGR